MDTIGWKQTMQDLRADLARRRLVDAVGPGVLRTVALLFKRGVAAVVLYRLSRYCLHHRLGVVCRLLALIEFVYTKNEISPFAALGPGLVLGDGGGIGITRVAVAGRNCTFHGCVSITLGAMEDFDVARDRIVIGDHCVFGSRSRVMRPVSLADGTQIKSNSIVLSTTRAPGTTLSGVPARRSGTFAYEDVVRWNPLRGDFLSSSRPTADAEAAR